MDSRPGSRHAVRRSSALTEYLSLARGAAHVRRMRKIYGEKLLQRQLAGYTNRRHQSRYRRADRAA